MDSDQIDQFRSRILERKPLRIRGGGSKDFYGGELVGDVLDTRIHSGIVNYDPTELVITLKAGTTLKEAQLVLATRRQNLATTGCTKSARCKRVRSLSSGLPPTW